MTENNKNKDLISYFENTQQEIIGGTNYLEQKYFFNPKFSNLPKNIQDEIQIILVTMAEKLGCIFLMGVYKDDGELYFQCVQYDNDFNFDNIGSELEIKKYQKIHKELIESIELWYKIVILGYKI